MTIYQKAKKFVAAAGRNDYRRGLRHGVAPAIEHAALLRSLPPLNFVVDVGANGGQFSMVARRLHPAAHIHAFEPLSTARRRFSQIFLSDSRVTLHQVAIGRISGSADLHVSARDDSSSLLPITALQDEIFPGTSQKRLERVQVRPLNGVMAASQILPPAMMKIDVQGGELDVLVGVGDLLPLFDYVLVEASFVELYSQQPLVQQVLSHLNSQGFDLSGVYNTSSDSKGRSVQADFLFTRRLELL